MRKSLLLLMIFGLVVSVYSQTTMTSKEALENIAYKKTTTGLESLNHANTIGAQKSHPIVRADQTADLVTGLVYDWQSNAGLINRICAWEDGTVSSVWTHSRMETFTDRGTGLNYFDGTGWVEDPATVERVEDVKTGFGSLAPWGPNGEVTVAHAGDQIVVSTRETKGTGGWTYHYIEPPQPNMFIGWPVVWTSGENREYIHVLYNNADQPVGDQATTVLYSRSSDGGATWDIHNTVLPELDGTHYPAIGSNAYCFLKTKKDLVAFIVCDGFTDGFCMKSSDNGDSWEKIVFFQHPDPFGSFENMFFYPRYTAGAFDANGKLHIAFEYNGTKDAAGGGSYFPGIGGVIYWNEDMPVRDTGYIAGVYGTTWIYRDATGDMPPEYIGYYLCLDPVSGEVVPMSEVLPVNFENPTWYPTFCADNLGDSHGKYNCGTIGMPEMMIDEYGNIYVIFIGIADNACVDGKNYFRIFGTASSDGGVTWNHPVILTKGFMNTLSECVYPYLAQDLVNKKVCFSYQSDGTPGTFVMGDQVDNQTSIVNLMVDPIDFGIEIIGVEELQAEEGIKMVLQPNPANTAFSISLNGSANVKLYNLMGQLVQNVGFVNDGVQVDVSALSAGVYFVTAESDGTATTQKLIVK